MSREDKAEVSRRGLLRAGTIAAGVGAVGVASAVVATPALASDGSAVVQGQTNTGGDATTTIANNSTQKPALTVSNPAGPPLSLDPSNPNFSAPVGSVFADHYGALYTVGDTVDTISGPVTQSFVGRLSPAFSTSIMTVTPERWLVTLPNFTMPNGHDGRSFVVPASANYDSSGRVVPKNNNNVPDLSLDFSTWYYEYGIYGVQGTLLVMNPTASGWVSLYDSDVWPGTSSMNFQGGQLRDGFTQMGFTVSGTVNFKLSVPAVLVFDIFAFITGNGSGRTFQTAAVASATPDFKSATKIPSEFLPQKRS